MGFNLIKTLFTRLNPIITFLPHYGLIITDGVFQILDQTNDLEMSVFLKQVVFWSRRQDSEVSRRFHILDR